MELGELLKHRIAPGMLFRRLLHQISHADDAFEDRYTESGQGVMRIVILSGLLLTYLATYHSMLSETGELNRVFVAAIFSALVLALFTYWHIRTYPGCEMRKVFTTAIDSGYIALGLYYAPESAGILLPIYLWLSIGNGFRYGVGHLVYTSVLNLAFFTLALLAMSDGRLASIDGKYIIGIYVAMIVTPAYTLVLFKRLSKSLKDEREVSRFKSRFLANMSHELRTPINAILNANMLLVNARRESEKRRYSNLISSSSKTLLDLIDQVLDLNKIEARTTTVKREPVLLYELLMEIADSVRANTELKRVLFKEAYSPELPLVINTDGTRVKQILINLLNNATKFTVEGGIIFRACLREADGEPHLHFSVEDTGPGIAEGNEDQIFKPFFQEASTFDANLGGAGIGLSISQSFANLLGGEIRYRRHEGKTVFECWLPLDDGAAFPSDLDNLPESRLGLLDVGECKFWGQLKAFAEGEAGAPRLIEYPRGYADRQRAAEQAGLFPLIACDAYFGAGDRILAAYRPDTTQTAFVLATKPIDLDPMQPEDFLFDRTILIRAASTHGRLVLDGVVKAGVIARLLHRRRLEHQELQLDRQTVRFSGHVLVIDDNDINRMTLSGVLGHYGIDTSQARDGTEGLALLARSLRQDDEVRPVDLILCDLQMPGMSGYEFVDRYRERVPDAQRVPILILTADIRSEIRADLEQRGIRKYLTKPIDPRALIREVGEHLRVVQLPKAEATELLDGVPDRAGVGIPYALIDDMADNGMPPEQIHELVGLLEANAQKSFRDLYLAYDSRDRDTVAFLLHRLVGSLSALGAVELAHQCLSLLDQVRGSGLEQLERDDILALENSIDSFIAGSQARLADCMAS